MDQKQRQLHHPADALRLLTQAVKPFQTVIGPEFRRTLHGLSLIHIYIYDLLFYAKNPAELHQEVIDALFRVEPPMSAAEQKNVFDTALTEALDEACSYDVVQSVHEQIRAKIEDHKESHDPDPLELTVSDVGCILANSGVDTEKVEAFKANCEKQYGENAALNPVNIIESRKFQVTTPEVKISIAPENSYLIETRIIDGRKYLLIPADDGVEVNGIGVNIAADQPQE